MTLRKKATVLSIVGIITIIGIIISLVFTSKITTTLDKVYNKQYLSFVIAKEFSQTSSDLTNFSRSYVVTGDPSFFDAYQKILQWRSGESPRPNYVNSRLYPGETKKQSEIMQELGFSEKEFSLLAEAENKSNTLADLETQAMMSVMGNQIASGPAKSIGNESPREFATRILFDSAYQAEAAQIQTPVNLFFEELEKRTGSEVQNAKRFLRLGTIFSFSYQILISIVLIIVSTMFFQIVIAIKNTASMLQNISEGEGDLTRRLEIKKNDEIGELSKYFNLSMEKISNLIILIKDKAVILEDIGAELSTNMNETAASINQITSNLENMKVQAINQSAGVVETSATMVAITGNIEKLNNNIDQQSSSVIQSSASIEEMLANIASVMQTLIKNSDNVEDLAKASESGHAGLSSVSEKIREIAKDSEGLIEISSVIARIASQTNLLSMNAAIEAAHAGDSGRGFAVVADEIRKLAESSSAQAKTVSTVLKKIKTSVDLVMKSTDTVMKQFEDIDGKIKTVSEYEYSIRNSMDEQSAGSNEILLAIGQLTTITADVKSGSAEMLSGSQEVIKETEILSKTTREVSDGMNEVASGAQQITIAINEVNTLTQNNRTNIQALSAEIEKFKV
ncbi:MAG TPA: HAMP domain-containing methyl-accepting chemotaxis protein [Treponemataceae bacterium]|nr:HAMP domain-containing methyl-accepting chemotaxis protein [Treponemataceae bacterium]